MADEPKNPQQIIDDATKALGQSPPLDVPPPAPVTDPPLMQTTPVEPTVEPSPVLPEKPDVVIPTPSVAPPVIQPTPSEPLVIPPKDQKPEPPPQETKPPKKKGNKGMIIGMLLFFILTLPVAIYYGSQQYQQITEGRSKATFAACVNKSTYTANGCATAPPVLCGSFSTEDRCTGTPRTARCCQWNPAATNTPTRPAATRTPTPGGGTVSEWSRCELDKDCKLGMLCGATSQCVRTSARCPRCPTALAPDGDPCSCSATCRATQCTGSVSVTNTPTPTSTTGKTIIQRGCIGGQLINTTGGCQVCSFGGIMTCAGPSGGSGGDPCQVKYSDNSVESVTCNEANMIRCNCGGNAWVGGRPGVTCVQLCACAGINCDACTPTPGPTNPNNPTNTPAATDTPEPTNTPTATNAPEPTATNAPEPTATPGNPVPGTCDASCESDSNCESGLSCYSVTGVKRCRVAACPDRSTCQCPVAQDTAIPTTRYYQPGEPTATARPARVIAEAPVATATQQPTPKVPVSGIIDVKAIIITIGSILLLALGLIL
jgi:hypothetical protein